MDTRALLQKSGLVKRFASEIARYKTRLKQLPLASHTKEAYRSRLNNFLGFVVTSNNDFREFFDDPACRTLAVREYKSHIKRQHATPATVNSALTAIDHFFQFLGFDKAKAKREDYPSLAPRALCKEDQARLLVFADHARAIDRALIYLLLFSGIRLSECTALDVSDLLVSERKGKVIVREGKGGQYREVPLGAGARAGVQPWLTERAKRETARHVSRAVFLNPQGKRMSARSIDKAVRKLGTKCGIELSPHVLRHTCLTNLVRGGNDLVLVSQVAGHKKLETTKRYTLASGEDLEAAMEKLSVES